MKNSTIGLCNIWWKLLMFSKIRSQHKFHYLFWGFRIQVSNKNRNWKGLLQIYIPQILYLDISPSQHDTHQIYVPLVRTHFYSMKYFVISWRFIVLLWCPHLKTPASSSLFALSAFLVLFISLNPKLPRPITQAVLRLWKKNIERRGFYHELEETSQKHPKFSIFKS